MKNMLSQKNKMDIMWLNKDYVHTKEEVLKKAEDMRLSKIELRAMNVF